MALTIFDPTIGDAQSPLRVALALEVKAHFGTDVPPRSVVRP
jgi:hypothetical protein